MAVVWTDTMYAGEIVDVTQAAAGVAGILNGAKAGLFTNDWTPSRDSVIGDATQPTYAGYALQAITWSAARRDDENHIVTDSGLQAWQMSDDLVPTSVLGIIFTNSAGTTLLGAMRFDAPINLATVLDWFGTVAEFAADAPQESVVQLVR